MISWILSLLLPVAWAQAPDKIVVGSKNFTESFLLAEMMAQVIESETGLPVERKLGLAGSTLCFESLRTGEVDLYPEYSGTGALVLFKDRTLPTDRIEELRRAFEKRYQLTWLEPFGFDNSFALAVRSEDARKMKVQTYSDLASHRSLRAGFSYEFLTREDGYPALANTYGFGFHSVQGMVHELALKAIRNHSIDLTDAYATDGELLEADLTVLQDDRKFFPSYLAAPLARMETLQRHPEIQRALEKLGGKLDASTMRRLNLEASRSKGDYAGTVSRFLMTFMNVKPKAAKGRFLPQLVRHVELTFLSVALAALVAIPLAIAVRRRKKLASAALGFCGIVQTIPSLAMLGFLLPVLGVGVKPAVAALFLYSLLPIFRNSLIGLREIPQTLIEVAQGLGLTSGQTLLHVELPLATKVIVGGVRTSAVIAVGTATLAAFIGAGGFGEPIVTGIALNDTRLILSGAVPAAALALGVEALLWALERHILPRRLRMGLASD